MRSMCVRAKAGYGAAGLLRMEVVHSYSARAPRRLGVPEAALAGVADEGLAPVDVHIQMHECMQSETGIYHFKKDEIYRKKHHSF